MSGSRDHAGPARDTIYFDNAATSWPKPDTVAEAMIHFMMTVGANPGRSGHRLSVEAGRVVNTARERVAELFNLKDPMRIIFTPNATHALNLGMQGVLRAGDHVVTGSMEHNSVMRPLRDLELQGVEVSVVQGDEGGFLRAEDVGGAVKPNTAMIIINHGSNVVGSLAPIREIGRLSRDHKIPFMVDTAQTAGSVPIDIERDNIDLLAFTGHKGLFGPQGTGGLAISEAFDAGGLCRVASGGTGSRSELEEHPDFLPDKYEAGTLNTVGLAGLAEGARFIRDTGVGGIRKKEMELTKRLIDGAKAVDGLKVYGGLDETKQTSTVSLNIDGMSPSDLAFALDDEHNMMCRAGLHCAPRAHRTIGTFPGGTVRFGMGYFNTPEQVDTALEALGKLVKRNG